MISHVLYPAPPTLSFRSVKSIAATLLFLAVVVGVLFRPMAFAFPVLVAYVAYGLGKTFFLGLLDRLPTGDPLFDEADEEEELAKRPIELAEQPIGRRRRRGRGRRTGDRTHPFNRQESEGGE
jgi:CDP-diacylglycerol--serine O-phosphatidyltransferase